MGKNHIERILYIDRQIRNKRYPSRKDIAEQFEVSIKTVERDISYLRDRLMAPISYDKGRRGYYYYEEGYFLPSLYMTEGKALSLFISHHLGSIWRDTPFSGAAGSAWEAFEKLLPRHSEVPAQAFSDFVAVIDRSPRANSEIWIAVLKSAVERRKLFLKYRSPGHSTSVQRTIHPYRLIHHRDSWHILCFDEYRKDIRIFALFRVISYKELKEKFQVPEDFILSNYIDPQFGIFKNEELFTVKFSGAANVVEMFSEHLPEKEVFITEKKDGRLEMSFTTNQKQEIKHLILQWGSKIEVLEPIWLRTFLYDTGEAYCKLYENVKSIK